MKTTKTKNLLLGIAIGIGTSFATVAQNVPNYVPTNGLVGWWPFNGNANDESGNGNNGTVNGATLTADRFGNAGKAYGFDGVSNYISTNYPGIISTNMRSVSFWAKTTQGYISNGASGSEMCAVGWGTTLQGPQQIGKAFRCSFNMWATGVTISCQDAEVTYSTPSAINDDNYHHYVFVQDISSAKVNQIKVYQDGLILNNIIGNYLSNSIINVIQDANVSFGYALYNAPGVGNYQRYFKGQLDDIGIWNRALTQQEITDLYNANICYQTVTVTDTLLINMGITGFNPVTYNNTIKIFPNPTNDHITINYGNFASLNGYQLKITNSLGQQMFQTAINQQASYISLASWTGNGLYFVHIIDPQGNTIDIRKIVLQ